jgi:hypothetical protein
VKTGSISPTESNRPLGSAYTGDEKSQDLSDWSVFAGM